MIEFNDRIVRPQSLSDVLSRDHFTGRFEKQAKDLERLLLKSNPTAIFEEFDSSKIKLERAKLQR